jgi:hypothetical protein
VLPWRSQGIEQEFRDRSHCLDRNPRLNRADVRNERTAVSPKERHVKLTAAMVELMEIGLASSGSPCSRLSSFVSLPFI